MNLTLNLCDTYCWVFVWEWISGCTSDGIINNRVKHQTQRLLSAVKEQQSHCLPDGQIISYTRRRRRKRDIRALFLLFFQCYLTARVLLQQSLEAERANELSLLPRPEGRGRWAGEVHGASRHRFELARDITLLQSTQGPTCHFNNLTHGSLDESLCFTICCLI